MPARERRDDLLKRARYADTTANIDAWAASAELRPPDKSLAEFIMCAKCDLLNRKIEHYKLLLPTVNHKTAADGLNVLIARHEEAKRALHPEAEHAVRDERPRE